MTDQLQSTLGNAPFLGEYERLQYMVRNVLSGVRTSLPVVIKSVTNSGGVSPIGYVDIQPLVSQVAGNGQVFDHGTIYNVPYMRVQGGANAIIIDPQVGDIGIALFCDRDISAVKDAKKPSAPSSKRKHDMSDAIYMGSIITSAPTQYIQFNDAGITINSPNAVNITANVANITAPSINLGASGQTLLGLVTSAMTALFNSHVHTNGNGGANTGAPTTTMGAGQITTTVKGG
jgi:hypothetical protein